MQINHKARKPHQIDFQVGVRLKARRKTLGISQKQLANCVGVSFQQLQKYESGTNRIGAGRLFQLAQALQVSVEYFFWGLSDLDLPCESTLQIREILQVDSTALRTAVALSSIADNKVRAALDELIAQIVNT